MSFFASAFTRVAVADCKGCGIEKLHKEAQHLNYKQVGTIGKGGKKILIIAPPPTYANIAEGGQFTETSYEGMALASKFKEHGIDLYADCLIVPAVPCVPIRKSRDGLVAATAVKTECCRPTIVKLIKEFQPTAIIAMGSIAISVLWQKPLQDLESKASAYTFRGFCVPDYEFNCWVFPTLNYVQVYDQSKDVYLQKIFDLDIARIVKEYARPLPAKLNYKDNCHVLTEYTDVVGLLERLIANPPEWLDFDYEANCLKPQTDGAILWTVAVDDGENAYAFPFAVPNHWTPAQFAVIHDLWGKVLRHRKIKKSAHHLHMEHSWSRHFVSDVNNWGWDSLVAQHHINTERGTKGLKIQAFLRFGIHPYNTYVDDFLKGNPINRIHEVPLREILIYNAQDAFYTRHLRQRQMRDLRVNSTLPNKRRDAFVDLYLPGAVSMSEMSLTGFRVDVDYYKEQAVILTAEADTLAKAIKQSDEVRLFESQLRRPFLITSDDDLRILLYDIIGIASKKATKKGAASVDAESLEEIDIPFVKELAKYKKLVKITGTFIAQFMAEVDPQGYIHTNFHLHVARSGRSSSSAPNFQNIPKRSKAAKDVIRSGIFPLPGFHMAETDYASQEVRIFACHCKDPVLINYLLDPTTDMHRDQAVTVYDLPGTEWVSQELRQEMKMGWVFALLYGSYFRACAAKMWDSVVLKGVKLADPRNGGHCITVREHLAAIGITSLADFVAHCKKKEEKFWDVFHVTKAYHEQARQTYLRKGYIETMFGFVRGGIISANKIINTPTQGTGFQCILWSSNEIRRIAKKEKWLSRPVGQIHDALVSNIHSDEIQHVHNTYEKVMCHDIRERFDWIIVPLEIEAELAPVDMPWTKCVKWAKINDVWQPAPKSH